MAAWKRLAERAFPGHDGQDHIDAVALDRRGLADAAAVEEDVGVTAMRWEAIMQRPLIWRYFIPFRLKAIRRYFGDRRITVLDVGCGINSFLVTRYWLPRAAYYGLDQHLEEHAAYYKEMAGFYTVNLECESLDVIPNGFFDVIILSHVIEHMDNGLDVIRALTAKLAPGGLVHVETPSLRTLQLPSAVGFLHFHDDATHKRLYSVYDVANTLLGEGCKIIRGGRRRDPVAIIVLGLPAILHNLYYLVRRRRLYGRDLWDLVGAADFVLAQRRPSPRAAPRSLSSYS